MFKYERDGYTVYPSTFKRKTGRRGVSAVCDIYRDGKRVAQLDDQPERIVATVQFSSPFERQAMVLKARQANLDWGGRTNPSDDEFVSEYARKLTMDSEQAWVAYEKANPPAPAPKIDPATKAEIDEWARDILKSFCGLRDRWEDEKEYEDFNDYVEAAKKLVPMNFIFVGLTKRPFALTVQVGGWQAKLSATAKRATLDLSKVK